MHPPSSYGQCGRSVSIQVQRIYLKVAVVCSHVECREPTRRIVLCIIFYKSIDKIDKSAATSTSRHLYMSMISVTCMQKSTCTWTVWTTNYTSYSSRKLCRHSIGTSFCRAHSVSYRTDFKVKILKTEQRSVSILKFNLAASLTH
jgi:hypothetical protein